MPLILPESHKELLGRLSEHLKMSRQEILAIAIQRLHNEVFFEQAPDDGPLSDEYRAYLQDSANKEIKRPIDFDQSLLD